MRCHACDILATWAQRRVLHRQRGIRAVCNAKYNQHTEPLFFKTGVLNLYDTLELNFFKLGNSIYQGNQPGPIQSLFNIASHKQTRAGNKFQFAVPRCWTNSMKSLTAHTLPLVWNNASDNYNINLQSKVQSLVKNFKKMKITEYGKSKCINKKCYVCKIR